MSESLLALVDLPLAWRRVKADIASGRVFVNHPYERRLIEADLDGWIATLATDIRTGSYVPASAAVSNVPKAYGAVRPGGIIPLRDQLVYAALLGACAQRIRAALEWPDPRIDYSYPISDRADRPDWFVGHFKRWRQFRIQSLEMLAGGTAYVVMADIAGYYENIDLSLLTSDLRGLGVEGEVLQGLSQCLNKWASSGKGIMQGFSPSDILGKLYLDPVDRGLRDRGYKHLRYVDDYRIFCPDFATARRALVDLSILLRKRGLVLQTSKSTVHGVDAARPLIDGIQPVLIQILGAFVDRIAEIFGVAAAYFTLPEAEEMLAANPDDAPIEIIRHAYEHEFIQATRPFDKTLFRFLLNRLVRAGDAFAADHAVYYLRSHPEETQTVLGYLTKLGLVPAFEGRVLDILEGPDAVYPYQHYQAIEWRLSAGDQPSARFIALARSTLFERRAPRYLRVSCMELLARFGSVADLDRLESSFGDANGDLDRAELICAVRRIEAGRRNAILGRFEQTDGFTARAVRLVRGNLLVIDPTSPDA